MLAFPSVGAPQWIAGSIQFLNESELKALLSRSGEYGPLIGNLVNSGPFESGGWPTEGSNR
jgi:hypothetical protein